MSEPIKISYLWNRENTEKLFNSSYKYQFNHSAKRYIGWFFIAILQFAVVAALKKGSIALLLFASIILLYWYYVKKIIAKKRAIRSFEHSSFKDKTIHIEVSNEGFEIKGNEGKTMWHWEEIDGVLALGDDIMLYKAPYFHYIPAQGFRSLEEKSRFKTLAKQHHKLLG
ncbi:FIG01147061: hypothetical protein [hydrothermal vent metagenome]|uniref:YcxB-like protein domain-containing protein n=1 Tax=hydrothermal vent metagenome TaxID=652676 RepID=A0A1W1C9B9_9ZZZZ